MLPAISHTNTMLSFVIFLAVISFGEAVSLSLVRVACARDPTLPFCDSHILGDPITSTPKPLVTTPRLSAALGLDKKLPGYDKEQQQQFLTWLSDQKDEVPDADIDTEELESSHHVHSDVGEYCMKYKANFHHYCKNGNVDKLEGVLPQFCTVYGRHCGIDDFPKPGPLLESKEQFKEETAKQPSGSFKGSTTEYCGKFLEQYNQLCSAGGKSTKAEEFCSSYKQSCNKSAAKPNSDLAKEIEDIDDFPEPAGVGGGAPPSEEEEENETTKKPQVARYCDKYWENYNFYCAGESSADHEKFCRSYRSNCPQKVGSLKESASFLGGKGKGGELNGELGGDGGEGGEEAEGGGRRASLYLYKGTRDEYCNKFAVNYEYYCTGDSDNPQITAKFCPSYKKACKERVERPPSPFTKPVTTATEGKGGLIDANFPDFEHPGKTSRRRGKKRPEAKKRPCTADCDQRIFPHCTQSCKCDYAYPAVQKFCNPPPLPFFLNTCRLWYAGCPKYEQYHYASQFVYSKAEKGKKVELPVNSKPFSVVSPGGERIPVVVRQPGVNTVARDDPIRDTVDWASPVVLNPEDFEPIAKERGHNTTDTERASELLSIHQKKRKASALQKEQSLRDDPGVGSTAGGRKKDTPIVPSDSVFSNALQQYGAFTDTRGILHRPRSRSPFTKPGLWEANPDNPHNRDHANKWYYHPESVNVDWLNGQLAWGAHWAVPAAGVGGTDGFSALHFPTAGTFLNIPDDYD